MSGGFELLRAVALRLEHRTLNTQKPGSNRLAAVSKLGTISFTPRCSSSTRCINEQTDM